MSVPKLRFKEFDGEWHQSSLGQLTNYFKGYAFKSESYKERGVRIIRVSDLGRDSIKYDNDAIFLDEAESSDYENWMLKKHDIIITTVGSKPHLIDSAVGRPIYIKNNYEGLLNQNLLVLRPINNEIEPYFIFSQLLDNKYLTHIETIQRGNANQSNITVKDLQEFKVFSTAKSEQTKIASFLSAVDEKIKQLTQKHELLSQYKQGMMQKLFSQQIRFKADDGSDFEEWEKTILGKIGIFLKGKGISKADIVQNGAIPCIRYGELYTQYGEVISNVISATNLEVNSLVLSKANDVLIPASGETQIDIATASCVLQSEVALSGDLNIFRTEENGVFLSYLIRSHLKMQIAQLAQGNSVVHLYSSQLKGVQLNLPCLEEQTKIANFLSAIDQKIEVVVQQIEQVKHWKKGLLQQMFV
ncbi:restriction endonuclease subunit S [Acinetobacter pittii]|uniref:restriction endonuclease subunit S n=1 Tax=Acinetobacter pittii TaxID=48296 RepID=UPI001023DC94|nr:restriction endonuclease subunit S [Acinetobacter pittii]RZG89848.1 restriction endonuclease subunit S [Acinetobacter pittii]